ncbi:MAG: glucose 1-dehydrogenase [Lentisphaeria bacterium]|nr:glucose 1-dehydrogenase [Lentisphaeria bacterium]NQZ69507.1 glucose 1-dehydrogenase [Lentisphaeria bacterium]
MAMPKTPSFQLTGRRAVITGASRGIGLAAAAALAEYGAELTLIARNSDELNAACKEINDQGGNATAHVMDVTDTDAMNAFFNDSKAFDILVNNAGMNRPAPAIDVTQDDFEKIMDLNVKAAFFMSQGTAKRWIDEGKSGSIINVSSQMGHVGGIERSVYCASKHAMEGFTKSMALEWGEHGIRVNTVSPTFIETEMAKSTLERPEMRDWVLSNIALGRVGQIEDIMGAIIFLASDASAMVTGSSLRVDGAWTSA